MLSIFRSVAPVVRSHFRCISTVKTALYDKHVEMGAKMVPFAGYEMPVQYAGVLDEHHWTRAEGKATVFDVSHMGQVHITGADRKAFMERVSVADVEGLGEGKASLSLITNEQGGIIDDTIVCNAAEGYLFVVVNAGNKHIDLEHMQKIKDEFSGDVKIEYIEDRSLLALQGKAAADILSNYVSVDLSQQSFMSSQILDLSLPSGVEQCRVTRCGYTGEDGFEISVRNEAASDLLVALTSHSEVAPAGLGARDSLRLEAGLCLHGHDINDTTTPVEGTLMWTIPKRRRQEGGFTGHSVIMDQFKNKTAQKKRVGFKVVGRGPPPREGAEIYAEDCETKIGEVTSGTMGPTVGKPVGMGYTARGNWKAGTPVKIKVRKKFVDAVVAKMPFVPAGYYQGP